MLATHSFDALDDLRGMTVVHGEFVLVSSDHSDCDAYRPFAGMLACMKASMTFDVLFVAQAVDGQPVPREIRAVDERGLACDPAESDYGHAMLDLQLSDNRSADRGRLSVPVTAEGWNYGTVCCALRGATATKAELNALQSVARMISQSLVQRPGTVPLA